MRIASWDDFAERAKKMYLDEPMRTRYIVRYNHSQKKFCAKVTDDFKVCSLHPLRACRTGATILNVKHSDLVLHAVHSVPK